MKLIDRTGERYERLVVLGRAPNKSATDTNARWACKCDCGTFTIAYGQDLAKGKVKSCGCWNAERIKSHGMSRTHVYGIWKAMKARIADEHGAKAHIYAGKELQPEWEAFEAFYADMGEPPTKRHTIERMDGNLGYLRGNCKWATYAEQNLNTSQNHYLEFDGQRMTVTEWAKKLGMDRRVLFSRICTYGWTIERALTTPVRPKRSNSLKGN
jgi:hypothetical protein